MDNLHKPLGGATVGSSVARSCNIDGRIATFALHAEVNEMLRTGDDFYTVANNTAYRAPACSADPVTPQPWREFPADSLQKQEGPGIQLNDRWHTGRLPRGPSQMSEISLHRNRRKSK
jgi:hypothetical protein